MTDASPPPTRSRARKSLPAVVGVVLTLVCVAFIVEAVTSKWSQVHHDLVHANLAWLAAGLVVAALGMVAISWVWPDALRIVGGDVPRSRMVPWYFVGEIGKYIPGAVWAAVGRGEVARRNGVPAGQAYSSVGLSLIGLYLAAALTAAVLLPADLAHGSDAGGWLLLLLLVPIGLLLLHPKVLESARSQFARLTKRSLDIVIPPWRSSVGLVLRYVPSWLFIWASTWCVARALEPHPAVFRIGLATVLSWTVGFVTPTPGGVGAREAVFLLLSGLAKGPATVVAVASRLLFVIVDVVGALAGAAVMRSRARSRSSVDSGVPEPPAVAVRNER